jgi:phosphoglycerol transferase MdoB-like AlkP superfamily enzyme
MKKRLHFFLLLSVFWLSLFIISRILFLVYQFPQASQLSTYEILMPLVLGLRMDLAMTGYWLLLPGLILTLSPFISNQTIKFTLRVINTLLIVFTSLVIAADLELYKHWGFRLNSTPLMYLKSEALSSANPLIFALLIMIFLLLAAGFFYLYTRKVEPGIEKFPALQKRWALGWLFITASLILPIRGSIGVAPLNTGVVYFHKSKAFPNHAGINPVWNFLRSVLRDNKQQYPEDFYKPYEKEFQSLNAFSGNTKKVISKSKPNVILIILESFTNSLIEPLGGMKEVTPNLNALAGEGILFTNFYASGDRTDKGLVSILSGYPAQPKSSIIKYPEKTQHLPYLSKKMHDLGYHTSFVYGGDIEFANMKSYLTNCAFDHITEENTFEDNIDKSKWGVADHYVFNELQTECDTAHTPFFTVMLSLSSHEPFIVPMEPVFKGNDERTQFLNAAAYADKSLGDFIREAKKKEWWENTLVIITADHGHRLPGLLELKDKNRFKIPMLWLGGVISKDSTINTFANQTDIANTILAQLTNADTTFLFSRNILAENKKSFSMYAFNNGYGYVSSTHENIYDFDLKNFVKKEGDLQELNYGKAFMQKLFTDYNNK